MLNVIEGAKRNGDAADFVMDVRDDAVETREERKPYDWSNVVFAAQYCEQARAEYEERLAC